jgi:hypothetical protein
MKKSHQTKFCPQINLLIEWYNDSKDVMDKHNYSTKEITDGVKDILSVVNTKYFTGQSCAMLFSMLGNYGFNLNTADADTKNLLTNALLRKSPHFNPQEIANTLNAATKLDLQLNENLQSALVKSIEKNIAGFNPQDTSNTLNAITKLDLQLNENLQSALVQSIEKNIAGFNPQDTSNTLNAITKLDLKLNESLKSALVQSIEKNIAEFNSQAISNTLNSLTKLDLQLNESLKSALVQSIEENVAGFNPQAISNTLNALTKLDLKINNILKSALVKSIEKNIAEFNSQAISNTLNSLTKLDLQLNESLKSSLVQSIEKNIAEFNSQAISNTLNSLTKLSLKLNESLKISLVQAIEKNIAEFKPQNIANTLNALTKLDLKLNKNLQSALVQYIEKNIAGFNAQETAGTLNSLAKLNMLNGNILLMALNNMHAKSIKNEVDILQIYSAIVEYCGQNQDKWQVIERCLQNSGSSLAIIKNISNTLLKASITKSRLQNAVAYALKQIADDIIQEEILHCHIVDFYIPSKNMVIEVNGPYHFTTDGIFNVDTKYKQASLIKLGYKVVNINYYDWSKLTSNNEKTIFLKKLLNIDSKVANQVVPGLRATAKPFVPSFAMQQASGSDTNKEETSPDSSLLENKPVIFY